MMEFSSPVLSGTLPSPRSWHASAVLPRQRIFIHGGYDGEQILTDSFVLELSEFNFFSFVLVYLLATHKYHRLNILAYHP